MARATHVEPTLAVTAFFTAIAVAAHVHAGRCALIAAAVFVGQCSIGWCNDYLDAPLDRAAGRSDKPVAAGVVRRGTVGAAAGVALVADVPLSLAIGWRPGAAHLVAVGWAWLYDGWLKTTWASVVPFAVSFGLVPVIVATALPGAPLPQAVIVAAGSCCGVAAHFANTLPDVVADARTGVRGLPQLVGPRFTTVVSAVAIAVAAVLLVVATSAATLAVVAAAVDGVAAVGVALLAVRSASSGARDQAFRLVIVAVAILVAAFVVSAGRRLTG